MFNACVVLLKSAFFFNLWCVSVFSGVWICFVAVSWLTQWMHGRVGWCYTVRLVSDGWAFEIRAFARDTVFVAPVVFKHTCQHFAHRLLDFGCMHRRLKSVFLQKILSLSPLLFSNIPASIWYTVCLISDGWALKSVLLQEILCLFPPPPPPPVIFKHTCQHFVHRLLDFGCMHRRLKSVPLQEILSLFPLLFSNIPVSSVYTVFLISDACIGA